jgi:hypothetical protein
MGVPVLVIGASGSGKSSSLRNFENDEIGLINVVGKPLPFKSTLKYARLQNSQAVREALSTCTRNAYIIDDAQYLMSFEEMDTNLGGYDKWNSIGYGFIGLVRSVYEMPESTVVYFLMHTEVGDDGKLKAKTLGKLIDNHFTLEGLFEIAITSDYEKGEYIFRTRTDGMTPFKNPPDMLPDVMPNDLKQADSAIRDYWSMQPLVDEGGDSQ